MRKRFFFSLASLMGLLVCASGASRVQSLGDRYVMEGNNAPIRLPHAYLTEKMEKVHSIDRLPDHGACDVRQVKNDSGRVAGTVTLDCYYNCEWRLENGKRIQYHYVWEDTANSGFSKLAGIIQELGLKVDELHGAPTAAVLSSTRVYIIVDPDTPAETEQPHYIDPPAIDAILSFVKDGGVLVLLGNDKGNMEFRHMNDLAGRFGIHFNEDSYHRVAGNDFEKGKFSDLPNHPVFSGVKQIYMKEISSLALQEPARPILVEDGRTFMASSRFGKGLVVAVGDPWLYNEYIDSRKLPATYENAKAGKNLFRWLLEQSDKQKN